MSFALLLCLQLFIKLLLEFLFGEVHFTNGSVVFYPPLASWRKDIQFRKCLCDILGVSCLRGKYVQAFNAGLARYTDEKGSKPQKWWMLWIMEFTVLAVMVITFKDWNNIIFKAIKRISSNPNLISSKEFERKLQSSLCVAALILDKPEVRIQSTHTIVVREGHV